MGIARSICFPPPAPNFNVWRAASSVEADGRKQNNVVPAATINIDIGGEGGGRDNADHYFNTPAGCADSVGSEKWLKFAGPCAQGVLDPLISHVPFWLLELILIMSIPGEHRP